MRGLFALLRDPSGPSYFKRLNVSAQLSKSSPLLSLSYFLNFLFYSRKNGNTLNHLPQPPLDPNPPNQKKSQTTYMPTRILTHLLRRTSRMGYSLVPEIKAACSVARTSVVNE